MVSLAEKLIIRQLGRQPYEPVWQAMKTFTDTRTENTVDECWLVEHDPVFTLGQAGKEEHILVRNHIPIIKADRGGQVTYHGPGQLVIYWLVNIKRKNIGVRDFVSLMEQVVIDTLASFGVKASLKQGAPGVYVNGAKIAALGLRVRKGCTYHGLSINIDMDLTPFQQINPCGYQNLQVAQLSNLIDRRVSIAEVQQKLLISFMSCLQYHESQIGE